ncbi:MAG: MBL fold metallo-hydrolase [Candidatus Hydrogenedentes bacterium]|nr:MBL fold metallo-hydrolase [Candidatus Hydrogenedentota bacterium]
MRVLFLGTGTSVGVPVIGCTCPVCTSTDPRNNRLRVSLYIRTATGFSILIDTGPDLRQQALRYGITRVDAVLFTHAHADHIFGMDDLRRFNRDPDHALPCYADRKTSDSIKSIFGYSMNHRMGGSLPLVHITEVENAFELGGVSVVPVPLKHGRRITTGYRIGGFAYLTDCNAIPQTSLPLLEGLDVLVIDGLRYRPHPTHFTIPEAIDAIERIGPRHAYITHLSHEIDHATVTAQLPDGIELAYDGLDITVPSP